MIVCQNTPAVDLAGKHPLAEYMRTGDDAGSSSSPSCQPQSDLSEESERFFNVYAPYPGHIRLRSLLSIMA